MTIFSTFFRAKFHRLSGLIQGKLCVFFLGAIFQGNMEMTMCRFFFVCKSTTIYALVLVDDNNSYLEKSGQDL